MLLFEHCAMMFIYVIVVYVNSDPVTYIVRIRFAFWNRVWQKKEIPATRAQMNTKTLSLKSLSGGVDFWNLERILIYWMCIGVKSFALVLNVEFRTLGWLWMRWLGVFIAPNHFLAIGKVCWRWAHETAQCRTGQSLFTVRCAPRQRAR
jgi:hypothetical protein